MSFSTRRRLVHLLDIMAANWFLPFLLGVVFTLFVSTTSIVQVFESVDKTGFSFCVTRDH